MTKNLLIAAAFLAYAGASAQCEEPVLAINENFSEFTIGTSGVFPQECWSANTGIPMMYTEETADQSNQFVVYYNSTTAGATGYLVSPAVSNVDGNHTLSFTTWKVEAPGGGVPADNMLVQVGTLTDPDDYNTFAAFGAAIEVTAEAVNHADIVIPAIEGNAHIAFKIIAAGQHNAVAIDDVVWNVICEPVAYFNEGFDGFVEFTEECWSASAGTPMIYPDFEETESFVSFYSMTSPNVDAYLVSPEVTTMDGNHQLSFDISKNVASAPGDITVQVGTLAVADDYSTFVAFGTPYTISSTEVSTYANLVLPASETQKYIAFQMQASGSHVAAILDNVSWEVVCNPVATFNETFDGFTDFNDECWSASAGAPMIYPDADEEETYISFYSFTAADVNGYLVSPEISTMDGNHKLSFEIAKNIASAPGDVIVQVGTLATAGDYSTFAAFGTPYTITSTEVSTYENLIFPASETQKYIAFQIKGTGAHVAAILDNVVWEEVTAGIEDTAKNTFSIYPNPSNGLVSLTREASASGAGVVSVYNVTGAKVFETAVAAGANTQEFDLSSLSSGMYLVKFESGDATATKKLVIK